MAGGSRARAAQAHGAEAALRKDGLGPRLRLRLFAGFELDAPLPAVLLGELLLPQRLEHGQLLRLLLAIALLHLLQRLAQPAQHHQLLALRVKPAGLGPHDIVERLRSVPSSGASRARREVARG